VPTGHSHLNVPQCGAAQLLRFRVRHHAFSAAHHAHASANAHHSAAPLCRFGCLAAAVVDAANAAAVAAAAYAATAAAAAIAGATQMGVSAFIGSSAYEH